MKRSLLSVLLLFPFAVAEAGVDQGNPKRVIYNMVNDYKIELEPEWTETQLPNGALRLDVHLTYREDGYFLVAREEPTPEAGMQVCGKAGLTHWIGKDCANVYFARQFERVKSAMETVVFPKIDGGTR